MKVTDKKGRRDWVRAGPGGGETFRNVAVWQNGEEPAAR
jgi:hypothetical protein